MTIEERAEQRLVKKMELRKNDISITGDLNSIRPFLSLLLIKRGFNIAKAPSTGARALIHGTAHRPF